MLIKDNPYIPTEDKDFFILLRIGLWQRVDEELSCTPEWEYIYQLACEQTVQGIVADGIGLYRKEYPDLNISQEQIDKFLSASAQIVRRNFAINQLQARICKLFNEQEVRYVVMKGQAVAQSYPKPMLRCSGDIDFYFNDQHFELAKALLIPLADSVEEEHSTEKHIGMQFGDIEVELHAEDSEVIDRRETFKMLLDDMFKEGIFETIENPSGSIKTAPATFHVMYILLHFCTHYYSSGLGLRQICDWCMLLYRNLGIQETSNLGNESIDSPQLHQYIKQLNLEKQWDLFLAFAQEYFGLEEKVVVHLKITKQHETLWSHLKPSESFHIWHSCKSSGNFGHNERTAIDHTSRKDVYKRAFIDTHVIARKQWSLSHKMAIQRVYRFYKNYSILFFQKIFHIGGQGFRKYE